MAAAERAGRLLRLRDGVVLLPSAPALAMRELARLTQPFTTSQARQALGTTRRVAIPLLEHLDTRGWTRRLDAGRREVRPATGRSAEARRHPAGDRRQLVTSPMTRLMVTARITVPNTYDSRQCRSTTERMVVLDTLVSDTW